MSYSNYEEAIQKRYRVILEGWPLAVKMVKPSAIGAVDDISLLFEALSDGSCKWRTMTSHEYKHLLSTLKNAPAKTRATWSDKGTSRDGKKRTFEHGGEAGLRKRAKPSSSAARVAKKLPPSARRESSDSGSEDEAVSSD
jgi:hypothetical protein